MVVQGTEDAKRRLPPAHPFDIDGARARLAVRDGGYEVVHRSAGLEIGVYVLRAPEPDRQQPHQDDEVYVVLEGRGVLEVEGKPVELREGHAVFVPAGAAHRFTGYEQLTVLVIFERRERGSCAAHECFTLDLIAARDQAIGARASRATAD
jgi:mannose-6-phosphate isomerase-like protein (cupin superfamily)